MNAIDLQGYKKSVALLSVDEYNALRQSMVENLLELEQAHGVDKIKALLNEKASLQEDVDQARKNNHSHKKEVAALELCRKFEDVDGAIKTLIDLIELNSEIISEGQNKIVAIQKQMNDIEQRITAKVIMYAHQNCILDTDWFTVIKGFSAITRFSINAYEEGFHKRMINEAAKDGKPYNFEADTYYKANAK